LVENLGRKVIGVARTSSDALAIGRTRPPGLILADIQLGDGSSGLDAVNDLLNTLEVPGDLHYCLPGTLLGRNAA
jgi:ActR/RegA family two-component response regulator